MPKKKLKVEYGSVIYGPVTTITTSTVVVPTAKVALAGSDIRERKIGDYH